MNVVKFLQGCPEVKEVEALLPGLREEVRVGTDEEAYHAQDALEQCEEYIYWSQRIAEDLGYDPQHGPDLEALCEALQRI